MINSSRLESKIERNLTRSNNGWRLSCASSKTRRLNSIQLKSRLIYNSGRSNPETWEGVIVPGGICCFSCCMCVRIPTVNWIRIPTAQQPDELHSTLRVRQSVRYSSITVIVTLERKAMQLATAVEHLF